MEWGAVIMLIFGCSLLFGGLAFFVANAIKSEKHQRFRI
ncbi:MetS family NSS transporter small subunit [Caloramator proteoclasticus]|nr:MetS family NSS transporter small subunit [Caloramator proteoclasticus]